MFSEPSPRDSSQPLEHVNRYQLTAQILACSAEVAHGHFDEMRDLNGQLRPHWQTFFEHLGQAGIRDLPYSAETIGRIISQNGVSYNVFSDNEDQRRPWSLNPLPLLITPSEWADISTALAQRAKLLDAILHDVYGQQRLVNQGLLPAGLVQGNPGYLRSLQDVSPLGGVYLHVAAFDIARGPDNRWWVVGQRLQSPSGLGYSLENRLIISRLFPQAYRDMRIQHVASSYKRLLDSMQSAAQSIAQGKARFALLTPGPSSGTYFEHAYLARYLGLPLVEGADLTVRQDKLYLKTVQGLQRIHGLLRRVDDDDCDPLELKPHSSVGVPGLVQAIRAGNLVMANALGTGFLESPAIQGFLPAISEYLFNERLKMPSLGSWWCGEDAAWQDIAEKLRSQVVKLSYPNAGQRTFSPVFAGRLDDMALQRLKDQIAQHPADFTTQDYLPFSQAPTWRQNAIVPRSALLRVYAIANGNGTWDLLPGGMARIAAVDHDVVSIQRGGTSLDTWVMTDQMVDLYSMLPTRVKLPRWTSSQDLVSSRAAENLFWLGRYTERCESMARLAKETLVLVSTNRQDSLPVLTDTISELAEAQGLVATGTPTLTQSATIFGRAVISGLTQRGNHGLLDHVYLLEASLGTVRTRLPAEHSEIANQIKKLLTPEANDHHRRGSDDRWRASTNLPAIETIETLDAIGVHLAALVGFQSDRMTRDLGWHLLTIGRLIERMINLSGIIEAFFKHAAIDTPRGFDSVLMLFDSSITYRGRYQSQQDILALLDLLVQDTTNPRSLACLVEGILSELAFLPNSDSLVTSIPIFSADEESIPTLLQCVTDAATFASQLSNTISQRFFAHAVDRHFAQ